MCDAGTHFPLPSPDLSGLWCTGLPSVLGSEQLWDFRQSAFLLHSCTKLTHRVLFSGLGD